MSDESAALEGRTLDMLRRMAALDPPPCFMGGWAEDALLAGTRTRPHEDFDWILPRSELPLRKAQAEQLGFDRFEVWGEAAPGEAFYLFAQSEEQKLDLGIADEEDGDLWMKVHRVMFEVDGKLAPAGYRARMPDDTFDHSPVQIDGITIRVASPLALYQIRMALAEQGSFGELSERQREAARSLRRRFMPDTSEDELQPVIERLR